MELFILLAYASLATLLQQLVSCMKFTLDTKDLFCCYKHKNDFYEQWQQHKQLKTMEMDMAWPDT